MNDARRVFLFSVFIAMYIESLLERGEVINFVVSMLDGCHVDRPTFKNHICN